VTFRRYLITFLLALNVATLVLTIVILGNASTLSDRTNSDLSGLDDFLVIARGDAILLMTLAAFGILGNLVLGYLLARGAIRGERDVETEVRPRITGE
jgi:hypothetical protein